MKTEESIEKIFQGRVHVSFLHGIGIMSFMQLKKKCVDEHKRFIPFRIEKSGFTELAVARLLHERNCISAQEVDRLYSLSCYYTILKKAARKALAFQGYQTVGELCDKCVVSGEFERLKGKKMGVRVNYEVASLLHHLKFLSEEAFKKVLRPRWKYRLPTDLEIGEDGEKKIHDMGWSKTAEHVIHHAVSLKFGTQYRHHAPKDRPWRWITVAELVKTFVRIDFCDNLVFYEKGHIGSGWYQREWLIEKFDEVFPEIEKKLQELGFLPVTRHQ